MQLSELRTAVLTRLGRPATDGFFTSTVLNDLINEALQAITAEAEWPWLQTSEVISTVAGTSDYTPNANWNFTKLLFILQDEPFTYVPLETLVGYTLSGRPSIFTMSENKIKMRNIPDAVYSVNHLYYKIEPILAADANTPLMPAQFHYAIVTFAAAKAYQRINDLYAESQALNDYKDWLRRLNKYRRRASGPLRPKNTRGY